MSAEKILGAAGAAVAGVLIGWAGNALTIGGRVTAIEATLIRIEKRLYPDLPPAAPAGVTGAAK